jgi:hypothetical protein
MHEPAGAGDPVVLLGRGGSGTRILSELAVATGVFIGNETNVTGDSVEWVEPLYALAVESLTDGIEPGSARDAFWCDALRRHGAAVRGRAATGADDAWGWKLPETMLVVPQVLRAFPRARVVHLVRHPVTTALRRTHMTSRLDNPVGVAVLAAAYRALGRDPAAIAGDDVPTHNAISWNFQVRAVLDALDARPPGVRVLQLRYEDVCADVPRALARIAAFLGRPVPVSAALPHIDASRTNAGAVADPRADAVWALCAATATRLGYGR